MRFRRHQPRGTNWTGWLAPLMRPLRRLAVLPTRGKLAVTVVVLVGAFVLASLVCFLFLTVRIGRMHLFRAGRYELTARFSNASGLREGAMVTIAGVEIGEVKHMALDDYEAVV